MRVLKSLTESYLVSNIGRYTTVKGILDFI